MVYIKHTTHYSIQLNRHAAWKNNACNYDVIQNMHRLLTYHDLKFVNIYKISNCIRIDVYNKARVCTELFPPHLFFKYIYYYIDMII